MEVFGGGHSRQTQVELVATYLWVWHYAHPSSRKLHTVVDVKGLLSVLVALGLLGSLWGGLFPQDFRIHCGGKKEA